MYSALAVLVSMVSMASMVCMVSKVCVLLDVVRWEWSASNSHSHRLQSPNHKTHRNCSDSHEHKH